MKSNLQQNCNTFLKKSQNIYESILISTLFKNSRKLYVVKHFLENALNQIFIEKKNCMNINSKNNV